MVQVILAVLNKLRDWRNENIMCDVMSTYDVFYDPMHQVNEAQKE